MTQFVLIANPENRRVRFFQEALARLGLPPARVHAYEALLAGQAVDLASHDVVRIESPGENYRVERALWARGYATCERPSVDPQSALRTPEDHGRLRHCRQFFEGYRDLLASLAAAHHRFIIGPQAIATMFDKVETHRCLATAGVPVAPRLPTPANYEELRQIMAEHGRRRVFIKLRYGSSASGVAAYMADDAREMLLAPIRLEGDRLYNCLRVQRYTEHRSIRAIIDFLATEGVVVEAWIPKASTQGHVFDLRLVVTASQMTHAVVRLSRSPMTNLHLGNRRGDLAQFVESIGERAWQRACHTAREAVQAVRTHCGERVHYAGVDLMFDSSLRHCFVLEINAFGDLLPGIFDARGHDTYTAQLAAWRDATPH